MTGAARERPGAPLRWSRGLAGLLLMILGGSMLGWMLFALFGGDEDQSQRLLRIGLAMSALGSACGQILMLFGGWLIWRAIENR